MTASALVNIDETYHIEIAEEKVEVSFKADVSNFTQPHETVWKSDTLYTSAGL